ncbi:hypothetical protein BDV93DRAFT_569389 [Ceratobasidium sp. AG-I]|nr:hypothetical protein BDV93DRAFT_569389 [Ceratobasidium sp. AG-I]
MARLKRRMEVLIALLATLLSGASAHSVNTTVYDTDLEHVSYGPNNDFCVRWGIWMFWQICRTRVRPWNAEVIHDGRQLVTVHRSLNHQHVTLTLEFKGSAIWVYGPSRAQLSLIPPEYKVCLYENHHLASEPLCYRVDVAEAYSTVANRDEPVVIFAKGDLQFQKHRVVVSVADPIDNTRTYEGICFSHAIFTTTRPTPWPVEEDRWRFRRVVMHDTHPLLSYSPTPSTCVVSWWCHDGWIPRTYKSGSGNVVSWHELKSHGRWDIEKWGVRAQFTAGAVAIYGIPKSQISDTKNLGPICVQINSGHCEIIDLEHAYLNPGHKHESVLLWKHNALDSSRSTHLFIRPVKTGHSGLSVFPFKEIHYFEQQEHASPGPPIGYQYNHDIRHNNPEMTDRPGRRCEFYFLWWCTSWFDPWSWREAGLMQNRISYRVTERSYADTESPSVMMDFRGTAVSVYGAPRSLITRPFASQKICLNYHCHIVDIEQAYLNAPLRSTTAAIQATRGPERLTVDSTGLGQRESNKQANATTESVTVFSPLHSELDPVLIWSMTGLDDRISHRLQLAFADLPCAWNAEMSIAKVSYTTSSVLSGPIPIPRPDRANRGPSYPPHASKWVSGAPLPALPTPPPLETQTWQIIIAVACPSLLVLLFLFFLWGPNTTNEREPLLPGAPDPCAPQASHPRSYSSTTSSRPNQPSLRPVAPAQPTEQKYNCPSGPVVPLGTDTIQAFSSTTTPSGARPENQNNRGPIPGFNNSPTPAPTPPSSKSSSSDHPSKEDKAIIGLDGRLSLKKPNRWIVG